MAEITLKGNKTTTTGNLPEKGSKAKNFVLRNIDLGNNSIEDYTGKRLVLNIFPSVDTGVCAASVRKFNQEASGLENTKVLCISRDLPFAQKRFCAAEGLDNVVMLSDFDNGQFGDDYGLTIVDGPMKGLHSRCVVLLDENHDVIYTQQVPEITEEPNYKDVINTFS